MVSRQYAQGRRKEYKIVEYFRKIGFDIVQRTAGSHSPVDIIAINNLYREIHFVQSKPDDWPESRVQKLLDEMKWLNGEFKVVFEVR